ncbi:hypothetical protein Ddye_017170 [Dipteronia dyeriana]|uniref:Transmembrane protein n=1 Tax=Dipteronia dyeriana TaxID=168575 RepID=A0AAD9X0A3_9ROSI|nr:hypothetical protein Ddye_017170 [Dipteronia dyeriana]
MVFVFVFLWKIERTMSVGGGVGDGGGCGVESWSWRWFDRYRFHVVLVEILDIGDSGAFFFLRYFVFCFIISTYINIFFYNQVKIRNYFMLGFGWFGIDLVVIWVDASGFGLKMKIFFFLLFMLMKKSGNFLGLDRC